MILHLIAIVVLLILCGFFSASETALFSLSRIERRRITERHPRSGKWALHLLKHPRPTLITILIGNMLVNVLATAMVTLIALETWGDRAVGLVLTVFTLVLILFGEILPKTLAVHKNETFSLLTAVPLQIFSTLVFPLRRFIRLITDWLLAFLVPERREPPDQISEGELRTMVKVGEEEGVFDRQERYMIQKVFELGERPVKDIMTPRTDLVALDSNAPKEEQMEQIRKYHFSHFPVYQDKMDNMVGVVSVQEYVLNADQPLASVLREPFFVPEVKRIDDLLEDFRKKDENFAICVDEYGGTAGIVTLEDILEEIFGEFYDEYAKVEKPIRAMGHREYVVEAKISLSDFNEFFKTRLKAKDGSTLSGFILERLGEVPEKGKTIKLAGCEIEIFEVIRHRLIRSVLVRMKP